MMDGGRERRLAERPRVEGEEQMVHAGVADQHHVDDIGTGDARFFRCAGGKLIQGLDDGAVYLGKPFLALGGIG
jgi:hypothetical protein